MALRPGIAATAARMQWRRWCVLLQGLYSVLLPLGAESLSEHHVAEMVDINVHADGHLALLSRGEANGGQHEQEEVEVQLLPLQSGDSGVMEEVHEVVVGRKQEPQLRSQDRDCAGTSAGDGEEGCSQAQGSAKHPPLLESLMQSAGQAWHDWTSSYTSFFGESHGKQRFQQPQWMRSVWGPLTGGGSNNSSDGGSPQVFFLFMTASGMDRPELWDAFFKGAASQKQYRVLIHCSSPGSGMCSSAMLARYKSMGIVVVDTVPTYYCKDLVSGMVQLLRKALPLSSSSRDKFVFLSESTLPVKPFSHVYQTLTADDRSDFCIMPSKYWVNVGAMDKAGRLVKHHQWFVLSRGNAKTLTERWIGDNERYTSSHWSVPACQGDCISNPKSLRLYSMPRNAVKQCTDEWAPFAMIYGIVMDSGNHMQTIPGISHSLISDTGDRTQGSCRTFVWWYSMHSEADELIKAISKDPGCNLSCYPCESYHPVEFLVLSDTAITKLRQSSFLFARKFAGSVMTVDQFQRLILS
eukprot:CAMPEP_0178421014 /NCGR_PEP_ID=MMETSP0689_2-20121128/26432_1 /TAXON_ID=160604 /ORGANISM="Amphidinium massartii, Strain CS-259" /LENGTH=522 /DNA_ID=CAMNT_0020042519 /DNA_START=39 /DNA_END=1607 /DNA_ORIENTATION=+